jgi:hypothetical protein
MTTNEFKTLRSTRPDAYQALSTLAAGWKFWHRSQAAHRVQILHLFKMLKMSILKVQHHGASEKSYAKHDRSENSIHFKHLLTPRQKLQWKAKQAA